MKINFLKTLILNNRARFSLALLASLISIWFALTPGAAQSKHQKRITSLQIGEASEGARVTVLSDSALNDYEAFRRGDRFYVTIPLADFTAGKPGFRGDGFEDVQVQKVGDSVVVSFKLQPGASARVDQHSNRLEVIFSSPNRMARSNRTNAGFNRGAYVPTDGIVRVSNSQSPQRRQRDAAGPMPPDSPGSSTATRERVAVSERPSDFSVPRNQSGTTNVREGSSGRGNRAGNIGSFTAKVGASSSVSRTGPSSASKAEQSSSLSTPGKIPNISKASPSPTVSRYGSSSVATPSTSPVYPVSATSTPVAPPSTSPVYPVSATSTPVAPVGSQPVVKSPGVTGSESGKSRSDLALQWVKTHRQTTLIGGILVLCVLVFLAALLIRRRKNVDKAKPPGKTLAQPKHSADAATNSPAAVAPVNSTVPNKSMDFVNEKTARPDASELNPTGVPVASENGARTNGIQGNAESARLVPEQARPQTAAMTPNHAWLPASSSPGSSAEEDQEREVFEL